MDNTTFDHAKFYSSYPGKIIARPGYPARAAYKSNLIFKLFEKSLYKEIDTIKTYADIGGCFGFGANAMSYFIAQKQELLPKTTVFEIEKEFVATGKLLFPKIDFVETKIEEWKDGENAYDLFTLFDVIEHVMEPDIFLKKLSKSCKYILIKTPMETSGEWFGAVPQEVQGEDHEDGHINFWSPKKYETLLKNNNFDIIDSRIIKSIVPKGKEANNILNPEYPLPSIWHKLKRLRYPKLFLKQLFRNLPFLPWSFKRKIVGGGEHICLCKSKYFDEIDENKSYSNNNKEKALVSLVTGCYNGSQFIERVFNSIISQTYKPIELIFVNDGSTDNSLEIALKFKDKFKKRNIKFKIVDQENQGFYPTAGIKKATGKYITTLDIDDFIMPDSIKERTLFLEDNADYGAVRSNGYEVYEPNLEDCSSVFVVDDAEKNNEYIFEDLLLGKTNNWAGSYMVRASVLFECYPDHHVPGDKYGQNLQILMPAAYNKKVGFIDKPLMKYIRNPQSFTMKHNTYENSIRLHQKFKEIREFMLNVLDINSPELRQKLNQRYFTIFSHTAYSFGETIEFNFYYKQIEKKTISDKIKYHTINANTTKQYFYRVINKLYMFLKE